MNLRASRVVLSPSVCGVLPMNRLIGASQWQYRIPFAISPAPVVDETQIYLSGGNSRVPAYLLPTVGTLKTSAASALKGDEPVERYARERENLAFREVVLESVWDAM